MKNSEPKLSEFQSRMLAEGLRGLFGEVSHFAANSFYFKAIGKSPQGMPMPALPSVAQSHNPCTQFHARSTAPVRPGLWSAASIRSVAHAKEPV